MFDYIEKLRLKPERVKKQIAFFISFFIVGIIFVVWLSVIYPNFRQKETIISQDLATSNPSPVSNFSQTFSSGMSAISEQFAKIKETLSSFSTSPAYYSATSTTTTTNSEPVIP